MLPTARVEVTLDATRPASRIAKTLMDSTRAYYGDRLDVDRMQPQMDEIWVVFQADLTDDERVDRDRRPRL